MSFAEANHSTLSMSRGVVHPAVRAGRGARSTTAASSARRPGLSTVAGVLEINDGGLGLDPVQWPTTWFKGGDEPGVLTLTYMATTRTGHSYVIAVLAENPSAPIGWPAVPTLLLAIQGAFTLAAHG